MTKRSLASLALKLMAVYLVISYIPSMPRCLSTIGMTAQSPSVWISIALVGSTLLLTAIWIGLGVVFIYFSDSIAKKLVPVDEGMEVITMVNEDALYKVVFVCAGLIAFVKALPYFTVTLAGLWFMVEKYSYIREVGELNFRSIALPLGYTIQLLAGIFLMVRPGIVLAFIKRFQK